jgi:hypothetical protein
MTTVHKRNNTNCSQDEATVAHGDPSKYPGFAGSFHLAVRDP